MWRFATILLVLGAGTHLSAQQTEEMNSSVANSEAAKVEFALKSDLQYRQKVDRALNNAVLAATTELHNVGKHRDAARIEIEWESYSGFVASRNVRGVGDHDPIVWLYDTWFFLNANLGESKMKFFHLDDIWEFAYTIPVVFWCEDAVNATEYKPHFDKLAGATSYWAAMLACSFAMNGAGYALVCSPAGELCEQIVTNRIAPLFSDYFWKLSCNL